MQVIDYGLTKLDDHYSWASGWVETQLAEQRLRASGSVSSLGMARSSIADSEVEAAATDASVNQRLAARQARKLQRKWNKPNGFEWWDAGRLFLCRRCSRHPKPRFLSLDIVLLAPVRGDFFCRHAPIGTLRGRQALL